MGLHRVEGTDIAVGFGGAIAKRTAVDNCAGGVQQLSTWTDIDVALSSKTKSARLKVPSERVDLSHTGMCGAILRSTNHLSSLTAP